MNKGFIALAFAAGAAIGSAVTWKVLKDKYEQLVREEIDSVKESYARYYGSGDSEETQDYNEPEPDDEEVPSNENEEQEEYETIIHSQGYASHSKNVAENTGEYEVIPPDEVGIEDGYEVVTWYMFADNYMTDMSEEPILDWELLVGSDVADHFGEWEDDSVYVRNDATKTYYEILRDNRKYMHVLSAHNVDKYRYSEDE